MPSDADPAIPPPHVELIEDNGRPALAIGGAVQSVAVGGGAAPSGYWPAMLPDRRRFRRVQARFRGRGGRPRARLDSDRAAVEVQRQFASQHVDEVDRASRMEPVLVDAR